MHPCVSLYYGACSSERRISYMPPLGWKVTLKQETRSITSETAATTKMLFKYLARKFGVLAN